MIEAEIISEEKYIRLSLSYEKKKMLEINTKVEKILEETHLISEVYKVRDEKSEKEILIVECCSSQCRHTVGNIYNKILRELDIIKCV